MRVLAAMVFASLASPGFAQPSFEPPPLPPGCTGRAGEPCALLEFTRRVLAPALSGVTLTPVQGQPNLFLASTGDAALPAFRLMWIEEQPIAPERAAADFARGLTQPGRICGSRPHGQPTTIGQSFALRCSGGTNPSVQAFVHVVPGRQRSTVLVLLAPLDNGPALLARGERAAAALAQSAAQLQGPAAAARMPQPAYVRPPNYDRLRADCADDSDVARQIAGCEAVLANPDERHNYAIATNNRGHAYERSGDLPAALSDYDGAIARDPNYAAAHINRGRILVLLGRGDEALAAFDRSIALADDGWGRLERGRLLAARGELARALADLDEAVARMPGDADAARERMRIREQLQASQRPQEPAAPAPRNPLEAATASPARPYAGEALLRAPLAPLPAGEALLAYTRELLAPALGTGSVGPGASPTAFRAQAPGLPDVTVIWFEQPSAGGARVMMHLFERDLNGGCNDSRIHTQHGGQGTRIIVHLNTCPTADRGYQLWWLEAFDNQRSRLMLLGAPSRDRAALIAAGDRILAAMGVPTPPPAAPPQPPTIAPPPTSAEALAGEYGERLVEDFTAILADSVDRSCLAAGGIAAPTRQQARDWLTRYGQRALDLYESSIDNQAVLAAFAATAGHGASAELTALARHPAAQERLRLTAATRLDDAADIIVEQFERHLIINRIRLARPLSPLLTGAPEPLAIRDRRNEEASTAAERHAEHNAGSPELRRFIVLQEAWESARQNAIIANAPNVLSAFDGIVPELQAACVGGP